MIDSLIMNLSIVIIFEVLNFDKIEVKVDINFNIVRIKVIFIIIFFAYIFFIFCVDLVKFKVFCL